MTGSAIRTMRLGLLVPAVVLGYAMAAYGDVTTERASSILIFPRVLSDATGVQTGGPVDTVIQIANTSNSMVFAHCYYVNASPANPTQPPSVFNPPQWQEVDFDIRLTKQQPTHWVVSRGRRDDASDRACTRSFRECNGAGFDPGLVPPVPDPFVGELKCIEVDQTGAPINGNHLKGEATLATPDGDVSKYNAVGILGLNTALNTNDGDTVLCLGNAPAEVCLSGAEYNACPQTVILNGFADGATDPVVEAFGNGPSRVYTELSLVPCSQDFENQAPASVVVQFKLINEFEELFSASTTVTCWSSFQLSDVARVFDEGSLGSRFVQTRMRAATDEYPGFIGVAEEFHVQARETPGAPRVARAALNLLVDGERAKGDVIRLIEVIQ